MADVAMVKERPILFSGAMVRAILDGRKTQTRRVVKPQPSISSDTDASWRDAKADLWRNAKQYARDCCPYGSPGDRLWVREKWRIPGDHPCGLESGSTCRGPKDVQFSASCSLEILEMGPWRPSIFMPRWASRITLEVKGVRVERLQEISPEDSVAEGLTCRAEFFDLWEKLNEKRGFGFAKNPWVWLVEFKRVANERK